MKTKELIKSKVCFLIEQTPTKFKGTKRLVQILLLAVFLFNTSHILWSQDSTLVKKTKTTRVIVKKPDTQIKNKKSIPVKKNIGKIKQIPNPLNNKVLDLGKLNSVLNVSKKYESELISNSFYIDERGYHKTTFDIIKKQNGDFALVYGASTENLDIYSKGVLFTLRSNLHQKGNAMIITKHDEELRSIQLNEFSNGILSISYTCNDNRCINNKGKRDINLSALKYISIKANGELKVRNIDDSVGKIQLIGMLKPSITSNITVAYNFNDIGKLGLANISLGNYNMTNTLRRLPDKESSFNSKSTTLLQPTIKSFTTIEDKFLIYHDELLKTPFWNLNDTGLTSGILYKPVWPLLMVDVFGVANNKSSSPCDYDNDPYTIYTDTALKLNTITSSFLLSDGSLGILEKEENTFYFNVFDSELNRKHPHIKLADNIHPSSIETIDLKENKILFFYKTKSGTNIMEYRATIYDWNLNKILWSGTDILWQNNENFKWDKVHKLVRVDNNRIVAICFKDEEGHYKNKQTLEFRILTLKL